MAIESTKAASALTVVYKAGLNPKGKEIIKKQGLGKIKPTALDSDIYATAQSIATLLEFSLTRVEKTDTSIVSNV